MQSNSSLNQQSGRFKRFSPAKINLFLHITGKRDDGYHNLQTVFRLLDWGDTLTFVTTERTFNPRDVSAIDISAIDVNAVDVTNIDSLPIKLTCDVTLTQSPLDNLIFKTAIKLLESINERGLNADLPSLLPVIHITLDKVLPTGAGLGGGSSNAATTLLALNELWQLNLTNDELVAIGKQIGADVPIFIIGLTMNTDYIGEGIGEILTPIDLPSCHYLLLTPDAHINTAQLFARPELNRHTPKLDIASIRQDTADYAYRQQAPYQNVFEPVVIAMSPRVKEALQFLKTLETITGSSARMTGSGSCVFLPFRREYLQVLQELSLTAPCPTYFVQSLN